MSLHFQRSPLLLAVGHAGIDLCQGAIPALLPTLLVQHHLSYTAAAGLIFAANIVSSVVQPLFGGFADRLRAPWLMPIGLLIAGTGLALASFSTPYWLIALCIGFSGIGIAAFHPEAARLVNELAGKRKATAMSVFSLGGNVGFALGPLMITVLLLFFGLRGIVVLLLPLGALALLLNAVFKHQAVVEKSERAEMAGQTAQVDDWWAFARLTGAVVGRSIVFYGLNTFLALYWVKVLHQSQSTGTIALSVLLFAGLSGTLLGGRLADRYGRQRVVVLALSALLPLLLLFVFISPVNIIFAWIMLLPLGIFLFMPFSVMVVMGQSYLPNHVGTASGVTLGLAVTVGGITAPILGRVADLYGIAPALFVLACVPIVSLVCILTLPREKTFLFALQKR